LTSHMPRQSATPPLPYTTLFRSGRPSIGSEFHIIGDLEGEQNVVALEFGPRYPAHRHTGHIDLVADGDTRGLDELGLDRLLADRSEEHTSELQSRENLVCRLLLE